MIDIIDIISMIGLGLDDVYRSLLKQTFILSNMINSLMIFCTDHIHKMFPSVAKRDLDNWLERSCKSYFCTYSPLLYLCARTNYEY